MNKYIVPICDISNSNIYNIVIIANSTASCREKLMEKYSKYSESDEWNQFLNDLDEQDILIGKITDIEVL